MGPNHQNRIFAALLTLSLVAPIWVLANRHVAEKNGRVVETVVDYNEVEQMAGATGRTVSDVLREFKAAGVTSVAIQEDTISDLLDSGQAVLIPRQAAPSRGVSPANEPAETSIWVASPSVEKRILDHFVRLGYAKPPKPVVPPRNRWRRLVRPPEPAPSRFGFYLYSNPDNRYTPLSVSVSHARNLPVGLDPAAVQATRTAGMLIVARLLNYPGVNTESIRATASELRQSGVAAVIFGQDQVLGFRGLVETTADVFSNEGLTYGSVEFAKQKGDDKLTKLLDASIIRVHSIPASEMATLDQPTAVERYTRAARERSIRMCYLRLFDTAADNPVQANVDYIQDVVRNLQQAGFTLGQARPLTAPVVQLWTLLLLALATALGTMFLLTSFVRPAWYYTLMTSILACILAALIIVGGGMLGRKVLALLAAIVFPTAAAVRAGMNTPDSSRALGYWDSGLRAAGRLICATVISAAGGAIAAALLSERQFMLRVDQFAGVKLAHVAPMLLALLLYAGAVAWRSASWEEQKSQLRDSLKKTLASPMLIWQAVGIVAALALLAIAVARSGNEPGVGVSAFELKARALLDRVLFVRPRTKEFLIGHPVMLAGIAAAMLGRRRWAAPLIVFGTIGQVSALNTFCHIHTPIAATALRVSIGLGIGLVFGLILYAILRPAMLASDGPTPARQRRNAKSPDKQ